MMSKKNILCYVDVLIVEKFVWWNPDLKITGWCSEDGQKLFCAAQEPSGTRDGRQLRWWLGGRTVERRATIWTTLQCQLVFLNPISPGGEGRQICPPPAQTRIPVIKSMGGNSDNFCIFLNVSGMLETIFIGPESDHWLCLSLTDSLTNSLTPA